MSQVWYIEHDGRTDGPLSLNELCKRTADGQLLPTDRVSPDGQLWQTADKVEGLQFVPSDINLEVTMPTIVLPTTAEPNVETVSVQGYDVLGVIGSGGCGVVYRATQIRLDRVVAIKIVRLQPGDAGTVLARFEKEALALAKLQHPNIVSVFDYGHHDDRVYMVMELLNGEDLDQRIQRIGQLEEKAAWTIARQAATALAYAAKAGITHRDIKPANLYLVPSPDEYGSQDDQPMVKVMDFGLAFTQRAGSTDDTDRLTLAGVVIGTPAYMAPEQFTNSDVDHRADIYALGATVYHALTGHPPIEGKTVWDLMEKKRKGVIHYGVMSHDSAKLISAMLAPDPDRRVAGYEELIQMIDGLPSVAVRRTRTRLRRYKSRTVLGIATLGLLAVVAVIVLTATNFMDTSPRLLAGSAPAVVTFGRPVMLSDRANYSMWEIEGKITYEPDGDNVPVLTITGSVSWAYHQTGADRLLIGMDLHSADTVELLFAVGVGLRVNRSEGVAIGEYRKDGSFRPLTSFFPFPSSDSREGLVPYLSVEIQNVGDRWDVWFEHRHIGGVRTIRTNSGQLIIRTIGRAARIERVELERVQPTK